MRQRVFFFFFFSPLKKNIESFAVVVRGKKEEGKKVGIIDWVVFLYCDSRPHERHEWTRDKIHFVCVCVLLLHVLANCDNKVRSDASTWGGGWFPLTGCDVVYTALVFDWTIWIFFSSSSSSFVRKQEMGMAKMETIHA